VDVRTLYDDWAAHYDEDDNATRDLASEVLRQMLPALEGVTVLELGCGSGRNTVALTAAADVTAVDFSSEMLSRAVSRVAADNVRFVEHDLTEPLPFDDDTADLVVISLVLEHIEDIASVYREIARVLRAEGQALVLELHPVRQRLGKRARFEGSDGVVSAPAFLHAVSDQTSAALDAGLTLEELKEHGPEDGLPRLLSMRWRR
jgi:malonyl-CoA O-methyltransferase